MEKLDAEDLANIEALAAACLGRGEGWRWGDSAPKVSGFDSAEELAEELASVARKTFDRTPGSYTRHLYTVHTPLGDDESLIICHTGNGPTSEAHARFFSIAPKAVLALIAEVRRLSERSR